MFHLTKHGMIDKKTGIMLQINSQEPSIALNQHVITLTPITAVDHLKVLRSIITLDEEVRNEYFIKKAINTLNVMLAATQFKRQSFMLITRLCISSQLVHLVRTVPINVSLLKHFDDVVNKLIINAFNLPKAAMTELIFLPQQKGGLGITSLASVQLISTLALHSEMLKIPCINSMANLFERTKTGWDIMSPEEFVYPHEDNDSSKSTSSSDNPIYPSLSFSAPSQSKVPESHSTSTRDNKRRRSKHRTTFSTTLQSHSNSQSHTDTEESNDSSSDDSPSGEWTMSAGTYAPKRKGLFYVDGVTKSTQGYAGYLNFFSLFQPTTSLSHLLMRNRHQRRVTKQSRPYYIQHDMWMQQTDAEYRRLLKQKKSKLSRYFTLLATSKDPTSSAWLRAIPYANYQRMTDEEFYRSIHYRLGAPDATMDYISRLPHKVFKDDSKYIQEKVKHGAMEKGKTQTSLACPLYGNRLGEYNFSNCQCTGPLRTARHNLIKRLIVSAHGQLSSALVVVEDSVTGGEDVNGRKMVPDITVTVPEITSVPTDLERHYLKYRGKSLSNICFSKDLTITDIHATSKAVEHRKGKFAKASEKSKRQLYSEYNRHCPVKVLPFAISSVGELAPMAKAIIHFIDEMAARYNTMVSTQTLLEQIDLFLETSR